MIKTGFDGFLVPQKDEDRLFDAILLLANDVDQRLRIGQAARQTAAQRFDVRKTAGLLLEAIQASQDLRFS